MTLRRKWLLYLLLVHLLFLLSSVLLYRERPWLMIALELAALASLALGLYLLGQIARPTEYALRFSGLLQDRNYAARLHVEHGDELQPLVQLFNRGLDTLYQERLKLGEQRGFLDRLLEATPSAVLVFDFDGRISLLNASAAALLGVAEPLGKSLDDWQAGAAPFAEQLDAAGRRRAGHLLQQLARLPVGESRLMNDTEGRRYRAQRGQFFDRGFARDFLLIEELTEELESSERATYEKLVRVLAHEVNNTVAATGSVLESLLYYRDQLQPGDGEDFATAIDAVRRRNRSLGEFIERFARVVKMPAAKPHPCDLGALLEGVAQLYREPFRQRGGRLEWRRRDAVEALAVDANLLEQALLNILKNAVEAAEASAGEGRCARAEVHLELVREAQRIRLSIIDNGDRLHEVPDGQMFSPFFTTKKGGQGIGLLFVREVLHRHGIAYRLAGDGRGETRFDLWFAVPG